LLLRLTGTSNEHLARTRRLFFASRWCMTWSLVWMATYLLLLTARLHARLTVGIFA
jgi:hypothetical protein